MSQLETEYLIEVSIALYTNVGTRLITSFAINGRMQEFAAL